MKNLIATLVLTTVSLPAFADTNRRVDECYRMNNDVRAASYCASQALASEIDQLRRGGGGGGTRPPPQDDFASIVYCDQNGDPQLHRMVVDGVGQTMRDDVIKTFSDGDDEQERANCMAEVAAQRPESLRNFRTQCRCSSDGDPMLVLDLMNRQYKTLQIINLGSFAAGDDSQEKRDCAAAITSTPICNMQ